VKRRRHFARGMAKVVKEVLLETSARAASAASSAVSLVDRGENELTRALSSRGLASRVKASRLVSSKDLSLTTKPPSSAHLFDEFVVNTNHKKFEGDAQQEVADVRERLEEDKRIARFLFAPDSHFTRRWETCTAAAMLFTAAITPYEFALVNFELWSALFWFNRIIDGVFLCDLLKNFLTIFENNDGIVVRDHRAIAHHYIKGWFALDLVGCVPFDLIAYAMTIDDQDSGQGGVSNAARLGRLAKGLRVMKLLRLLKMVRILKLAKLFQHWITQISLEYSKMLYMKSILTILVISHWFGCLWIIMARFQEPQTRTWMSEWATDCAEDGTEDALYDPADGIVNGFYWKGCFEQFDVYSAALYWACTTITSVGYGDITPQNPHEQLSTAMILIFLSMTWAHIIGICSLSGISL
jgi:hypothetical protein